MTVGSAPDRLRVTDVGERRIHCKPVKRIQITVRPADSTDPQENVRAMLASRGVEVSGLRACTFQGKQVMLIVVDDGALARMTLEAAGFQCQNITSVVLVPLAGLIEKFELMSHLAKAGVGILYTYTFLPGSGSPCLVLKTVDDDHALRIIESCALQQAA